MSEQKSRFVHIEELQPGDTVTFEAIRHISAFEDVIAHNLDPQMSEQNAITWIGRTAFSELVRPPDYNGNFINIKMHVMQDPYEKLLSAQARGWKFANKGSRHHELTGEAAELLISRYHGFIFSADACSSGKGVVGSVRAEAWYAPEPGKIVHSLDGSASRVKNSRNWFTVRRFVTIPETDLAAFTDLKEQSVYSASEILREKALSFKARLY